MKIVYSPACLRFVSPGHPESPDRIRLVHDLLEKEGYAFIEPRPAEEKEILRVHSKMLLNHVKFETFIDADTPPLPRIARYAFLSAGAAMAAAAHCQGGEASFSLMRPPGHHATRHRLMGFCYLNNIAIAVADRLSHKSVAKAAILDIDCHHGNGTEDIFLGHPDVLFVSLHQSPLYPGTGLESRDNAVNFPLPPFTRGKEYLKTLEKACRIIADAGCDLLGVSAGFDTFREDPLAQIQLGIRDYGKIGEMVRDLSLPTFCVMEGGYSKRLPECVLAFLRPLS